MVAAVTLVYPWFNMLTAIGNLFGIGGSSVIARMLGAGRDCEVKFVSAFSVYGGMVFTLAFSPRNMVFPGSLFSSFWEQAAKIYAIPRTTYSG